MRPRPAVCLVGLLALVAPAWGGTAPSQVGRLEPPFRVLLAPRAEPPSLSPLRRLELEERLRRTHGRGPVTAKGRARAAAEPGSHTRPAQSAPPEARADPAGPGASFQLITRTDLRPALPATATSLVGEPCVAQGGRDVLVTGNWYAAVSSDGGQSFTYVDPETAFPSSVRFCCDQSAIYDPSRDLFLWLLLYLDLDANPPASVVRLAVAHGQAEFEAGSWALYDNTPQQLGAPSGDWFDYPQIGLGANSAYITANVFRTTTDDQWVNTVIARLSLDQLAAGAAPTVEYLASTDHFTFTTVAGAGTTMYWASHDLSFFATRVYRWAEGASTIPFDDVLVTPYEIAAPACAGPDGRNWCGRSDDRVLAGWVAEGVLGFLWNASQDAAHPYPYVRAIRLDEATGAVIDEPDLWSAATAWLWPSVGVNARGHIAGTVFFGGGAFHPSLGAFVLDDLSAPPPPWEVYELVAGTSGPATDDWGDFLCTRRASPEGSSWVATGFVLAGGAGGGSVHPQLVRMGRERDAVPCTPGAPCTDGNACTAGDACVAGVCRGGAPVLCAPADQCHEAGECDAATGCSNPPAEDGTPCIDPSRCILAASCEAGACVPDEVVACVPPDVCHEEGVCDPASGACTNPRVTAESLARLLALPFDHPACPAAARRLVERVTGRVGRAAAKLREADRSPRRRARALVRQSARLLGGAEALARRPRRGVPAECRGELAEFVGARRNRVACLR
jgi:hypothetical protein